MRLHPIAVILLPIPAMLAILVADGVAFALLCLAVGLVLALFRGRRFATTAIIAAASTLAILWLGFAISLPREPFGVVSLTVDWLPFHPTRATLYFALRGALRIVVILVLYVVAGAYVRWSALADTMTDRFGVSYRVMDVLGLGGRFAVLIRRDIAQARSLARLRARGRGWRTLRLSSRLLIPVLMRSFSHADELSIAMESRGFGALPERTVHDSQPIRVADGVAVAVVWAVSIAAALFLAE